MTAAEFADLPFGGHAGEWLSGTQAAAAPPPQPLVIEPPPWATDETGPIPLAARASGSAPQPTALEAMRAEDGASEWAPPPGPPLVLQPLLPVAIPPPDWRAEQEARARVAAREAQDALEPSRSIYPVPRGAEKAAREP